jgi:hypothetical protein
MTTLAEEMGKVEFLPCDNAPVRTLKKKPRQKHDCTEKRIDRGSKVEILHVVQGDFANGGSRPAYAQALTLEGVVRYSADRKQESDYHDDIADSPSVFHHHPWKRQEANDLARRAKMPEPYPDHRPPNSDNGERYLHDYFVQVLTLLCSLCFACCARSAVPVVLTVMCLLCSLVLCLLCSLVLYLFCSLCLLTRLFRAATRA